MEEIQPLLEVLTSEGSELADLAPGDTGLRVEDLISKDNKKFDELKEQVNKLAEKVQLSKQKSNEVRNTAGPQHCLLFILISVFIFT